MAVPYKNLAISEVAIAPIPRMTGTMVTLKTGTGVRFPQETPYQCTVFPRGTYPDPTNAEIVDVENVFGDVFRILRGQGETNPRAILVGDIFAQTITKKMLDEIATGEWIPDLHGGTIGIVIDGGGWPILPGIKGYFEVGVGCQITGVTVLSTDVNVTPGDIVIDIWKTPFEGYPPTAANSICAAAKPTLVNANKSKDTAIVGWQTSILEGDILAFHVDSAAKVMRVALTLTVQL